MAKPFEGFPATVLQTPDILGQGIQDVFRAKQIEAAQQPKPVEYGVIEPPDIPETSDIYGGVVQGVMQPLVDFSFYKDLNPDEVAGYIQGTAKTPQQQQKFANLRRGEALRTAYAQDLSTWGKSAATNIARLEEQIGSNDEYDIQENYDNIERSKSIIYGMGDANEMGYPPTIGDDGTRYITLPKYAFDLLDEKTKNDVIQSGRYGQAENGEVMFQVPTSAIRRDLTMNLTLTKGSSLGKMIESAQVGGVEYTNEKELEGMQGMYVTSGGKYYPKANIGITVASKMFKSGFNPEDMGQDGTMPVSAFENIDLNGPARREAKLQGYLDDGEMTAAEKKDFYEKNYKIKEAKLSTSSKRTLSGTGKGGGGYTDKLGAAPLQAQGKDLTQINVTDDAGMQRTRQGLGASIKPYVIKTSNPKNTKQNYMVVSDIFSTTDENGNPQVYLKGQYVSLKETDIFRDEGIAGINKRLAESEDETRALSDFVLSEQPTEWMLPNDELESQYRANIGRTVKETIDFDKLYSIPYTVRGMKAPEKDKDPLGIIE